MTTSNRILGLAALIIERFVLSSIFFYLAADNLMKGRDIWFNAPHSQANLLQAGNHFVLMLTGFFSSFFLFIARRATVPPSKLKLVLVPLFAAFFNLLYFIADKFPAPLRASLVPVDLQPTFFVVGMTIVILGHLIAFWAFLYLGRSFGVFVTVRKVVLNGPYTLVRHPMYFGWLVFVIGLLLTRLSIAFVVIIAAHIALLAYRARLEEAELADFSEEYRAYKQRTGFLFPKFWRGEANP